MSMSRGTRADKAGLAVAPEAEITIHGSQCPYVSRGGLKLAKALREFGIDPTGYTCSDSGASTGGFTDCLLQHGAKKVFAIDVGYGQLAWKIREDPRVVCMERTNIRYVTPEDLGADAGPGGHGPSRLSPCISFCRRCRSSSSRRGRCCVSSSPSLRRGGRRLAKKGVVRDPAVHVEVLEDFLALARGLGFTVRALDVFSGQGAGGEH